LDFASFIKSGKVKKGEKDAALAKSLFNTAKQDLKFLETLNITDLAARKVFSNYYDVLRSVIEAIAALDGFKIYSHEAYTFYLKENKIEEIAALKYDRFRKIRNKINYYGKAMNKEEAIEHKKEIKDIIKILVYKYLTKIE
jgi:hypothetical protein|tara:strand:- start:118 stop:540 length:423 start_codon:yes stop_codon:yes gene_type:complete